MARVKYSAYPHCLAGNIYQTDANQLVGSYKDLRAFRKTDRNYASWQAHHVLEYDDLDRLGIRNHAPAYNDQLCILLPKQAHVKRINSILRGDNPPKYQATARELRSAYADAYELMGDYCGGGEAKIRKELLDIISAEFQKLGVR
jgi:hypothetical protein